MPRSIDRRSDLAVAAAALAGLAAIMWLVAFDTAPNVPGSVVSAATVWVLLTSWIMGWRWRWKGVLGIALFVLANVALLSLLDLLAGAEGGVGVLLLFIPWVLAASGVAAAVRLLWPRP